VARSPGLMWLKEATNRIKEKADAHTDGYGCRFRRLNIGFGIYSREFHPFSDLQTLKPSLQDALRWARTWPPDDLIRKAVDVCHNWLISPVPAVDLSPHTSTFNTR